MEKPSANEDRKIMKTLDKGLVLMDVILQAQMPLTLTELQDLFPTDAGTLHRLLITLVNRKYLVQHYRTKRYSIGPRALMLNRAFYLQNRIFELGEENLVEISKAYPDAIASQAVNSGVDAAILVFEVQNGSLLTAERGVGIEFPHYCTAHGKALAAFQPPELFEGILARALLERPSGTKPMTSAAFLQELELVRKQGWASEQENFCEQCYAIAAPVLDPIGRAVASVGFHWEGDREIPSGMIQTVKASADIIAKELMLTTSR